MMSMVSWLFFFNSYWLLLFGCFGKLLGDSFIILHNPMDYWFFKSTQFFLMPEKLLFTGDASIYCYLCHMCMTLSFFFPKVYWIMPAMVQRYPDPKKSPFYIKLLLFLLWL